MRILWICDLIFRDFCKAYGVKDSFLGGWMSGMLDAILTVDDYVIGCCFPVISESKMLNGKTDKGYYYSFHAFGEDECNERMLEEFVHIFGDFKPDIIHIWGTEYGHSLAAVKAASKMGLNNRVIVHIQGLVSLIPDYFLIGIPPKAYEIKVNGNSIQDECQRFKRQGDNEKKVLSSVKYILGRTTWDKAYIESCFQNSCYIKCDEILRKEFYTSSKRWDVNNCNKHQIFVSQAFYALKGLHLIVPAIALLKKTYSNLKVIVGGINPFAEEDKGRWSAYGQYLHSIIDEFDIADVVSFIGKQSADNMIENYIKANVYVNCSTIENSSNSIGEAQMIGTPMVASYTGGTPDIVEHGTTGLLYQMDADYMFMSCIRSIFDDDLYAMELSKNEQKAAEERYDPIKVCSQLGEIYEKVAG